MSKALEDPQCNKNPSVVPVQWLTEQEFKVLYPPVIRSKEELWKEYPWKEPSKEVKKRLAYVYGKQSDYYRWRVMGIWPESLKK